MNHSKEYFMLSYSKKDQTKFILSIFLMVFVFCSCKAFSASSKDKVSIAPSGLYLFSDRNKNQSISLSNVDASDNNDLSDTLVKPYIAWLNTDFDAASYASVNPADHDHDTENDSIESADDLKDLVALAVVLKPYSDKVLDSTNFKLKIRTNGININLYKGGWSSDSAVLSGHATMTHVLKLVASSDFTDVPDAKANITKSSNVGTLRLAFEVLSTTDQQACITAPNNCYIEIALGDSKNKIVSRKKSYVNFLPVQMSYELPHTEMPELEADRYTAAGFDDELNTAQKHIPTFRAFPGVMLKFKYKFPTAATDKTVEWTFPSGTKLCASFEDNNCSGSATSSAEEVFYQLSDKLETTNVANTSEVELEVNYKLNNIECKKCKQKFKIKRRKIEALSANNKFVRGDDIAMLEQMLWQMGMSPQDGFPGAGADRIDNISDTNGVVLARPKNVYSTGHNYVSATRNNSISITPAPTPIPAPTAVGATPIPLAPGATPVPVPTTITAAMRLQEARTGSLEKMVRRLHGRYTHSGLSNSESSGEQASINGTIDADMVERIREQYDYYYKAYSAYPSDSVIVLANHASTNTWVTSAIALWDAGSYTQTIHNNARDTGETVTRDNLLRAWAIHESSGRFWGGGSPRTGYRSTLGKSDEFGSIGFNQILFQSVYGANQGCPAVRDKNQYHPEENFKNMTRFMSEQESNCSGGGSMNSAFVQNSYDRQYNNATASPKLRGYFRSTGASNFTAVTATATHTDDNYERLSKGIQGYNGGPGRPRLSSWLGFLIDYRPPAANRTTQPQFSVKYAIQIKEEAGFRLRTYTLQWTVLASEANTHFNAGDVFCFNYSEHDWLTQSWSDVKNAVINTNTGTVSCTTGQ